jgi:hypothetical protein
VPSTHLHANRRAEDEGLLAAENDSLTDPTNRDIGAMRPTKNKGGSE